MMPAERWAAVRALAEAALDCPLAERDAVLDGSCGGDRALRDEAARLVLACERAKTASGFLTCRAAERAGPLLATMLPPDTALEASASAGIPEALRDALANDYLLERELGRGGMATVYLAQDRQHGRPVAVKVLTPELRASVSVERFLAEIRVTARLAHPHILPLHASGEAGSALYYVMPFVDGETLRARLEREGRLPVAAVLRLVHEAADALDYAHRHGVVHRDVKPENILFQDGHAIVGDFGIARAVSRARDDAERSLDVKARQTEPGTSPGTPAYMAPEQARGDPTFDHRADLYALGVVAYEALAGAHPFGTRTRESMIAAHRDQLPPPLAAWRPDTPPALATLVMRLLAKDPAARPSTAAEVLRVLDDASPAGAGARASRRPALAAIGALLALAAVGGLIVGALWAYRGLRPEPARFEPNLLAVAPFDVSDSSLRLWREGLVDVLSLDLDGAGPLRTVPQTIVARRWSGRADRASAARLGSGTWAELVVFGRLLRQGADSVAIRAAVLDRPRDETVADLEVRGDERQMGALADSLGVKILRALGRSRPIGSVRHVSIGSRSLPALKEFLRGEQFYRLGRWDSAIARYERALAGDSTFALAMRRLSATLAWGTANWLRYGDSGMQELTRRVVGLNHGLPPRDSALIRSDSFKLAVGTARDADELVAHLYAWAGILEDLALRYPDDPVIWYELGEVRRHLGPPIGGLPARALEAFDRAIALDSGFAPAYEHTISLALQLGREDQARQYVRAYAALNPTDANAPSLRLVALVFDSGVNAPAVRHQIRSATVRTLFWAANEHLGWRTDSAEAAVVLLRELVNGRHERAGASAFFADSLRWRQLLASVLAFRGHLRAAAETGRPLLTDAAASPFSALGDPFHDLALLGIVEDSMVERTYAQALTADANWDTRFIHEPPRFMGGLPWWLSRGDTVSIARFAGRAAEVARAATSSPKAVLRARYFGAAATAYVALARADSAGAERLFQAIPDTLCVVGGCFFEKLALARLLAARGEDRRAAETLDRWGMVREFTTLSAVFAALERARVAERMGELERARERYGFVVDAWRRADPELQPYVTEARAGLARLAAHRN